LAGCLLARANVAYWAHEDRQAWLVFC